MQKRPVNRGFSGVSERFKPVLHLETGRIKRETVLKPALNQGVKRPGDLSGVILPVSLLVRVIPVLVQKGSLYRVLRRVLSSFEQKVRNQPG